MQNRLLAADEANSKAERQKRLALLAHSAAMDCTENRVEGLQLQSLENPETAWRIGRASIRAIYVSAREIRGSCVDSSI
jgi:hypothetical protein